MENLFIWIIVIVIVMAVFVPYLIRFRRAQMVAKLRLDEALQLGTDRPRNQFPQVNRTACIGCGACVDVCPEGDVLAVVWGSAEVINGDHCIGHGHCETACPVGALKVGLGDIRSRPDIPILSGVNETSVPNIFIAGELSGIALIRHAVAQGRLVAEEISRRIIKPAADDSYDMIIIGAGPAGLTAALTGKQNGLSCLIIDQYDVGGTILHYPRRKLVMTQPVDIPFYGKLDRNEYSKEKLLDIWQNLAHDNQLTVVGGNKLEAVEKHNGQFSILTSGGKSYYGKNLVLALGRRGSPRKLGAPGEEFSKTLYQLVDAQSYNGQKILVVGGGDSAIEAAIGLARQNSNEVTISYRKSKISRVKKKNQDIVMDLISKGKIRAEFESEVKEIKEHSVIVATPHGNLEFANDVVFIQIGGIPPYDLLKKIGIAFGGDSKSINEADNIYMTA